MSGDNTTMMFPAFEKPAYDEKSGTYSEKQSSLMTLGRFITPKLYYVDKAGQRREVEFVYDENEPASAFGCSKTTDIIDFCGSLFPVSFSIGFLGGYVSKGMKARKLEKDISDFKKKIGGINDKYIEEIAAEKGGKGEEDQYKQTMLQEVCKRAANAIEKANYQGEMMKELLGRKK